MRRVSVTEAARDFPALVNRVSSDGISVELERDNRVVAHLTPAAPSSPLKVRDLNAFLNGLPKLEDDAAAFSEDIRSIRRELPAEGDPWA